MSTGTVDAVVFFRADEADDEFFRSLEKQDKKRLRDLGVDMERYGNPGVYMPLVERSSDYIYGGMLAIPGGHIDEGEEPEAAALRELEEETSFTAVKVLKTYENTDMTFDPRYDPDEKLPDDEPEELYLKPEIESRGDRFAYFTSIMKVSKAENFEVEGSDDAERAFWVPVRGLPRMAFLHHRIIDDALQNHSPY
ncbi:MAG: NUDIX domain-containing protein [Candidatus Nanohaloarchaea archaeon]